MERRTGAQVVADMFAGYGLTHVFFVPTILTHALYQMEVRTGIRRFMVHGEKSAAYMADGYARASGRPGVCMAQTIGAANLAAGLRDAAMACSPVIAITGGPYATTRNRHQYQEIDDLPLFKPVTKRSTRLDDVDMLPHTIRQAFRTATSDQPGPVHIEFAGHQGQVIERLDVAAEAEVEPRFARMPAFRPAPDPADVAAVARLLADAARPVLVLGGGVRISRARDAALALAERLSVPVATSLSGKSLVPADHPLAAGVVGLYSRATANQVVSEADLVVFVGTKTGSQVTHGWQVPSPGTTVVQCDISGELLGLNYPNAASLQGDARQCMQALLAASGNAGEPSAGRRAWLGRIAEITGNWAHEWEPFRTSDAVPIRPERLCRELTDALPADAMLVSDTGHAGVWSAGMIDLTHPGQDFVRAAGSLGWSLPAAIGAQCALPDRPVVGFMGDGAFWYHLGELETAVRWQVPVVLVVNNNAALNQEIGLWTRAYDGELHGRHTEMWRMTDVDLSAVARSIGAAGFRVERPGAFASAMEQALAVPGPAVVEVVTELHAVAPPAHLPVPSGPRPL